jgi:GxxExxY protein
MKINIINTNEKLIYKEISFNIMEAVFEVHNVLGPGYSENIYEEALAKEFKERKIPFERQKSIEVNYKGEKVGEYKLDMVIDGKIVLELKAVTELNSIFESQLISYLKATGIKLGILINFGSRKVSYKRLVV